MRRVSHLKRTRKIKYLRSRRCIEAFPVWRCSAGKHTSLIPQASVNEVSTAQPAAVSMANNRRKVA